jgi:hypothetical protein
MRSLFRSILASLLTARITVILVAVACIIGAAVGALTYLASRSVSQALLAAGTATTGSVHFLGRVIGTDPECRVSGQDNREDDPNDGAGQRQS